jgi:hypothetical protein
MNYLTSNYYNLNRNNLSVSKKPYNQPNINISRPINSSVKKDSLISSTLTNKYNSPPTLNNYQAQSHSRQMINSVK